MMQDKGKVELTWSNKNRRLVTLDEPDERGLLYQWVPPTDYRVAETRLLRQVGQVGTPPKIGNYLIRGDALHGLAALTSSGAGAQDLSGKVRLAYLDPPFNTGKTFSAYEDNLERSIWLTLMRDRLKQVQKLLRSDGTVWVHCDDAMMAALRMVMDEVFTEHSFVGTIVYSEVYLDVIANAMRSRSWFRQRQPGA